MVSRGACGRNVCAVLTSASMRPKRAAVAATIASIDALSLTSHTTPRLSTPSAVSSSTVRCMRCSFHSATTIRAPFLPRWSAMPRPIPCPAPVTITTRSRTPCSVTATSSVATPSTPSHGIDTTPGGQRAVAGAGRESSTVRCRSGSTQALPDLLESPGIEQLADSADALQSLRRCRAQCFHHGAQIRAACLVVARRQRWAQGVTLRQRGKRRVWLTLIPVGHRRVLIGEVVGVAVLDGPAQRAREADRIAHEPAIGADQPRVVGRLDEMEARIRPGILLRRARAAAEDLLGAGAVDRRRPGLAVDENHVIALAVPAAGDIVDLQQQADHLSCTGRLERDVVVRTVAVEAVVQLHV